MGYYTDFELKLYGPDDNIKIFLAHDPEIYGSPFGKMFYAASKEELCFNSGDSCKWYEHDEEMKQLSSWYPDILFELTGYGEEAGDIWRKFYKNGVQSGGAATIVFPIYKKEAPMLKNVKVKLAKDIIDPYSGVIPAGTMYHIEDTWKNMSGNSVVDSAANGNYAALNYMLRAVKAEILDIENVYYGKINGLGFVVHKSEIDLDSVEA